MLRPPEYTHWPPDYVSVYAWRQRQIRLLRSDPALLDGAKAYYRQPEHAAEFIMHWCDTYDPRNVMGSPRPARLPFIMFPKQVELIQFLTLLLQAQANGLLEKARDMGATWGAVCFSVWLWLFWEQAAVGWGSRKEDLVDRIGDPDSIFEKIRMELRYLPPDFLPAGFSPEHVSHMKIINPENGATITGEAGTNIGRGGRKLAYFKDESAHYEHAEAIEASLMDNTNCQVDMSSVSGLGTVFHRKREAGTEWVPGRDVIRGTTNVFVLDWSDHPDKDQAWYDRRRTEARNNGLLHVFAREVERNYAASVEGVIIKAEWVTASIDAHLQVEGLDDSGMWAAALDVADEGIDLNALIRRKGIVIKSASEWGGMDTGETTRRACDACRGVGPLEMQYDCVGVGAGVKAEANRLRSDGRLPPGLILVPWNAAGEVADKDKPVVRHDRQSPINGDLFMNFKAQAWWQTARRFERTWMVRTGQAKVGVGPGMFPAHTLISIDSSIPLLRKLQKELSQAVFVQSTNLKMKVEKAPRVEGKVIQGVRSPNLADGAVMNCWPSRSARPLVVSDEMLAYAAGHH